jgi:CheY-like chemotaxis protein
MRITVVDNDTSLLRSLRIILGRMGHDVQCFAEPGDALGSLADNDDVDVMLVDLVMPGMNGMEFLRAASPHLRAACRKALITGHAESVDRAECEDLGVQALFTKPLDLDALTGFLSVENEGVSG